MFHMFQVIYAHEWMNDAHVHGMQVQLGKPLWQAEPWDNHCVSCVLALLCAILVFVVILGFGPDLLVRACNTPGVSLA